MYSFLINGAVKDEDHYQWFTYHSRQPVELSFRGKPVLVKRGTRFGVRPSASKRDIRLILEGDPTRVITLTLDQANKLADGVKPGGA